MTNTENIPGYLKDRGRFCVWKYETRTNADGVEQKTKVPYNPRTLGHAQSNNEATFSDLATAEAAAGNFDGLGVGAFGELAALDIDHCIEDGVFTDMAADIIETMDTYTEISPSGEGLRLFFLAPGFVYDVGAYYINRRNAGGPGQGLEAYVAGSTNKFLTITGNVVVYAELEDRSEQLQIVLDRYMQRPPKPEHMTQSSAVPVDISDRDLLEKAMNANNGRKFEALWNGDIEGYPSHSEADQALCNLLAFWTGGDGPRIDALFRMSGLMREKWDRKTGASTYGADTIENAVNSCREFYTPRSDLLENVVSDVEQERPQVSMMDSFIMQIQTDKYRPMQTGMQSFDKLLGGGIMRQSLVVLSAAPGAGKTALASQMFEQFAANGNPVLFLNLEMSAEYLLARSLSRRLYLKGYHMTATDVLQGYRWSDDQRAHVLDAAEEYKREIAPYLTYNPHGDTSDITRIRTTLERCAAEAKSNGMPAPVVVLDYLHLLTASRLDAQEVVKAGIAMLKEYAIKHDTFVLAIAANNRESNKSGTISQSSARDSSAIEYTADIQLSLNYKALEDGEAKPGTVDKYRADNPQDMDVLLQQSPREMVVRVLKNRMAQAGGKLYMNFDTSHSLFTPVDRSAYSTEWMKRVIKV